MLVRKCPSCFRSLFLTVRRGSAVAGRSAGLRWGRPRGPRPRANRRAGLDEALDAAPGCSGRPWPRCLLSTWWQQRSVKQAGDRGPRCFFNALEIRSGGCGAIQPTSQHQAERQRSAGLRRLYRVCEVTVRRHPPGSRG